MAEPQGDDGDIDSREQKPHGGGMPEGVRRDLFGSDGRAGSAGDRDVVSDAMLDRVTGEVLPGDGWEQRFRWSPVALREPGSQHADGQRNQRCSSLLEALADGMDGETRSAIY